MNNYIDEAARTNSTEAGQHFLSSQSADHVAGIFNAVIEAGNKLDLLKKQIFYGRPGTPPESERDVFPHMVDIDIIHGAIGACTESAELLEGVLNGLNNGALDKEHLIEELGDVMWYQAVMMKALGVDFDEVGRRNIEKLRKRYPEKFTFAAAEARADKTAA